MPTPLLTKKRKAQIQIGESMIVIILIMIIAVFALVFTTKMATSKYEIKITEYEELDAVETAQIVTNLYELRCSKEGVQATCVDKYKAIALAQVAQTPTAYLYYYDLFKNAKVTLKEIYPNQETYVLYEVNATNTTKGQISNSIVIPVSLYDAAKDTVSFGVLQVERYHKRRLTT